MSEEFDYSSKSLLQEEQILYLESMDVLDAANIGKIATEIAIAISRLSKLKSPTNFVDVSIRIPPVPLIAIEVLRKPFSIPSKYQSADFAWREIRTTGSS